MATLFDSASLVMIPSGYKDDKLYSIKPTNGDGDFTFSRDGSGASPATRVNASGLIEKGRENVILQSNTFSNATWTKTGGSITGGQSGYDGSSDAYSFISNTAYGGHRVIQSVSASGVNTISIYAKANGYNYLAIYEPNNGGKFFDLANGVVGNTMAGSAPTFASIESVGNDWYRCSIVCDTNIISVEYWLSADGTNHIFTGDGVSGVFIQDAQLEQGLVATDVIETTTTAVSAGLLGDMPRLDYSGGATCPSLLLEPSRSNLIEQSEYYGGSYWTKSGASVTSGFTSPEGLSNAYKLVEDSGTSYHRINKNTISVSSATSYIISICAKKGERTKLGIMDGQSSLDYATFDLEEGTLIEASVNGSIELLSNGWYRCSAEIVSTTTAIQSAFYTLDDSYTTGAPDASTYTGDGTSGLYLYGAQVEAASYISSYIPTYGSAASRAADVAVKTSASSLINSEEGVVFVDVTLNGLTDYGTPLSLTDGSTSNYVWLTIFGNGDLRAELYNGAAQASITYNGATIGNRYKMAFAYSANDFAFYVNGTQVGTDTSGTTFSANTLTRIDTYLTNAAAYSKSAYVNNQALVFKTRLTNAELAALTTL